MALDLGCGRGHIAKEMNGDIIGTLYQCDASEHMIVSESDSVCYQWFSTTVWMMFAICIRR